MNYIREIRKEKGISQRELAEKIHVDSSTLSYYESGRLKLTFEIAIEIADILEISLDELAGRSYLERKAVV
jgi:transcriptional regulator with XRE-family HTH domain